MKRAIGVASAVAAATMAAAFGYDHVSTTSKSFSQSSDVRRPTDKQHPTDKLLEKPVFPPFHSSDVGRPTIQTDGFIDPIRFQTIKTEHAAAVNGEPIAGVVNHHVLASDLLARFFSTLRAARSDLQRIIIISPDHFKSGDATISIGRENYISQGKNIAVDEDAVETLTRLGVAVTGSRQLFEREHGIGALVPFIAVTFPDITIVPIAIRADVNRSDMEKLGRALKSLLNDKTFVLISSDMSHYLSENDALANDRETLSWLETLNADNFKKATDDNTDSGPSFVALSALFDEMGLKPNFSELDHSISSKYGGSRENTTSYITGFWTTP